MSDVRVVALVPVAGRACSAPLLARLAAVAGRVVVLGEFPIDGIDVVSGVSVADYAMTVAAAADVVLVHDPLRVHTPVEMLARVVRAVLATGRPVVPVLPCSDTVKRLDESAVVIDTPDRNGLRVRQSPLGYPAGSITSGLVVAGTVPTGAVTVPGDPSARRLAGPVDVAMIDGGPA